MREVLCGKILNTVVMEQRRNLRETIEEAETAPLKYDAKARAAYVRGMIDLIGDLRLQGKTVDEIKERVPEFARDYQNLFEAVTSSSGYDKQTLKTMLAMLDHMGEGQLTQHKASVIIGKKLADKYVNPLVNELNKTSNT